MADASIIDIGGTQWNVKDKQARNDIEAIKQLMTVEELPIIEITLNNGYSATEKYISHVQKYGKLCMGLIFIDNLSGENIGTNEVANFGKVNISLAVGTYAMGIEYFSSMPIRSSIGKTGNLALQESKGVTNGNNRLRIPIIWIEP